MVGWGSRLAARPRRLGGMAARVCVLGGTVLYPVCFLLFSPLLFSFDKTERTERREFDFVIDVCTPPARTKHTKHKVSQAHGVLQGAVPSERGGGERKSSPSLGSRVCNLAAVASPCLAVFCRIGSLMQFFPSGTCPQARRSLQQRGKRRLK